MSIKSLCNDATTNHALRKTGGVRYASKEGVEIEWRCKDCGLTEFFPAPEEERAQIAGGDGLEAILGAAAMLVVAPLFLLAYSLCVLLSLSNFTGDRTW